MRRLVCLWCLGMIGMLSGAWMVAANPPPAAYTAATAAAAPAANVQQAAASAMDAPLRLVAEAEQTYQRVQDYTCLFVKSERINGRLQQENLIEMKVRNRPFSVYMRWVNPKPLAGQEVCYVNGRNNGMMRVHLNGIAGVAGFMSIDPRDPRALENSRHGISEAGIGKLVERLRNDWELERRVNQTQVRIADYDFAKKKCTRVETTHADNRGGQFYSYRSVVYFDKETHLPIRFEAYDWPRQGGSPEGELLECYSYVNLAFNVGLGDDIFRH